jgi:hypothetical protein
LAFIFELRRLISCTLNYYLNLSGLSDLTEHFRKIFLCSRDESFDMRGRRNFCQKTRRYRAGAMLETAELRERAPGLLATHHYLGGVQAVGELVRYAVSDAHGGKVAVLIFAAALHLHPRDQSIGWSDEQQRRRRVERKRPAGFPGDQLIVTLSQ